MGSVRERRGSTGAGAASALALLLLLLLLAPAEAAEQVTGNIAPQPLANASASLGTNQHAQQLATAIGPEDREPTLDEALALVARSPAELGVTPDELADLLGGTVPLLEAGGRALELGAALQRRADLYLVDHEKDEIWAARAESYASWLAEHGRSLEARALQREVVLTLEERLGVGNVALAPHLGLLANLLAGDPGERAAVDRLRSRITDLKARESRLAATVVAMGGAALPSVGPGQRPIEKVQVYYATNRVAHAPGTWFANDPFFSATPGPMRYGSAEVWVPQRQASLAQRTTLWAVEVTAANLRHSTVVSPRPIASVDAFFQRVRGDASGGREILIYVHGFNMTFSDALKVTANLAVDLDINGPSIAYSWPSAGSLLYYWRDGRVVAEAHNRLPAQLAELISRVVRGNPDARVFLVAHSMGNRLAIPALTAYGNSVPAQRLAGVFLASPDVPSPMLLANAAPLAAATRRLTLYASGDDKALIISSLLNGGLRAGSPGAFGADAPGDKIDTTGAAQVLAGESDFLGHNDYMRVALADLRSQIWLGVPIGRRCVLGAAGAYFSFRAAHCTVADFTEALTALRRLPRTRALGYIDERLALAPGSAERERWNRIKAIIVGLP